MSLSKREAIRRAREELSPRQQQVLRGLAQGQERKEIAAALNISPKTVDGYCTNLFAALGVKNGREAAVIGSKAYNL